MCSYVTRVPECRGSVCCASSKMGSTTDGKCPKNVERSCNKIKILVLHLVGHFMCIFIENDAGYHERKKICRF
jgi:hypothetical protein